MVEKALPSVTEVSKIAYHNVTWLQKSALNVTKSLNYLDLVWHDMNARHHNSKKTTTRKLTQWTVYSIPPRRTFTRAVYTFSMNTGRCADAEIILNRKMGPSLTTWASGWSVVIIYKTKTFTNLILNPQSWKKGKGTRGDRKSVV